MQLSLYRGANNDVMNDRCGNLCNFLLQMIVHNGTNSFSILGFYTILSFLGIVCITFHIVVHFSFKASNNLKYKRLKLGNLIMVEN